MHVDVDVRTSTLVSSELIHRRADGSEYACLSFVEGNGHAVGLMLTAAQARQVVTALTTALTSPRFVDAEGRREDDSAPAVARR